MSLTVLPGTTRVLCGKFMSLLVRNPGTNVFTGLPTELRVDEFSYTPKVNSAKYADSLSSGFMKNTSGLFEADGRMNVLLTADGSVNPASGGSTGLGMQIDDILDFQLFTTSANRATVTAQCYGQLHVNSKSLPFKTADNKIAVAVDFTFEGQWTEQ
jgi:hypothetical protein